jgi:hypothetical protein
VRLIDFTGEKENDMREMGHGYGSKEKKTSDFSVINLCGHNAIIRLTHFFFLLL